MYRAETSSAERGISTAGAVLIAAPIILMFARMGDIEIMPYFSERTQLIDIFEAVPPPPPPPPPPTRIEVDVKAPGNPAPKAVATEIVAPPPKIVIPSFQSITAAPAANKGTASVSGARPNSKATATGTGAAGEGRGAGSGVDRSADPVMLRGVSYSDYPMDLQALWPTGTKVVTRLFVDEKGKVKDCQIVAGVGNRSVDRQTCRLLKFKGKFKPAQNAQGNPVASWFNYAVMGLRAPEPSNSARRLN